MAILILILIWVLVNYYQADPFTVAPSNNGETPVSTQNQPVINTDNNANSINNTQNVEDNEPIQEPDNNTIQEIEDKPTQNTEEVIEPKDVKVEEPGSNMNEAHENTPTIKKDDPVMISSSEKTSNTEKQEVLNEIDNALMELLQVVDKVQPVDETRLGIDESEVQ